MMSELYSVVRTSLPLAGRDREWGCLGDHQAAEASGTNPTSYSSPQAGGKATAAPYCGFSAGTLLAELRSKVLFRSGSSLVPSDASKAFGRGADGSGAPPAKFVPSGA